MELLGCSIDKLDMEGTLERCRQAIVERRYVQHVAVNTAKLVAMQDDARLRSIVNDCELINADGQAVVWAARLLKRPLPERVAGIDLMHRLLALSEKGGFRVYVLGARPEVLKRAVANIRRMHPGLELVGWRDGYFPAEDDRVVARQIRAAQPDVVFVAISSPRKEQFLGAHGPELGAPLVMGVGGAIDVVAGVSRRAPLYVQRVGLEWLFRLAQEPRRLWRRYLFTNLRFTALIARELLHARRVRANGA